MDEHVTVSQFKEQFKEDCRRLPPRHGSFALQLSMSAFALPSTVPLAALLRKGSLPLSSENLPAYCRATTEGKPASR